MNLLAKTRAHAFRKQHSKLASRLGKARSEGFGEAIRRFGAKPSKENGVIYLNECPVRERMAVPVPGRFSVSAAWFKAVQFVAEFDCMETSLRFGCFEAGKIRVKWWGWKLCD